jgi:small-conductance mechanosensitive channel
MKKVATLFMLMFIAFFSIDIQAHAEGSLSEQVKNNFEEANKNEPSSTLNTIKDDINKQKNNFSAKDTLEKLQDNGINILIVVVIFSAVLFILGWIVPPLRMKAWSLIGLGMLSYVLIMFPQNIIGAMLALIDWVNSLFFSEEG